LAIPVLVERPRVAANLDDLTNTRRYAFDSDATGGLPADLVGGLPHRWELA